MKKTNRIILLLSVLFFSFTTVSFAQVSLSVSKKASSKMKMAVTDFDVDSNSDVALASELKSVLNNDLNLSGYFLMMSASGVSGSSQGELAKWKQRGVEYLVLTGLVNNGRLIELNCQVFDLTTNQMVLNKKFKKPIAEKIRLVHQVSDAIIKEVLGKPGLGTSRISFVSNRSGNKQVYVVDWDGRNLIQLTQGKNISINPKWSPILPLILCTDYTKRLPHIYELDLIKQTKKPVSKRPGLNAFARYSPDGKKIVLILSQDGNPEVYTSLADGTRLKRLTRSKSVESSPCWTPDGKKIVFVSDRSGSPQLYWMNADGTNPQRLTYRGRYNTSPEVSPNGDLIAYCSIVGGKFQLFVLDPETKESVQITRNGNNNEDPAWGPDNRHLAYTSTKNYQSDIYLIDIYEGHPIRLTKGLKDCTSPSWSPSY